MATIVVRVNIDSSLVSNDTMALHDSLCEVARACAGLMMNETIVTSFIFDDDERIVITKSREE